MEKEIKSLRIMAAVCIVSSVLIAAFTANIVGNNAVAANLFAYMLVVTVLVVDSCSRARRFMERKNINSGSIEKIIKGLALFMSIVASLLTVDVIQAFGSSSRYDDKYLSIYQEQLNTNDNIEDAAGFFNISKTGAEFLLNATKVGKKYELYKAVNDAWLEYQSNESKIPFVVESYYGNDEILKNISKLSRGYAAKYFIDYSNPFSSVFIEDFKDTKFRIQQDLRKQYNKTMGNYKCLAGITITWIAGISIYVMYDLSLSAIKNSEREKILLKSHAFKPDQKEMFQVEAEAEEPVAGRQKEEMTGFTETVGVVHNDDSTITVSDEIYNRLKNKLNCEN